MSNDNQKALMTTTGQIRIRGHHFISGEGSFSPRKEEKKYSPPEKNLYLATAKNNNLPGF